MPAQQAFYVELSTFLRILPRENWGENKKKPMKQSFPSIFCLRPYFGATFIVDIFVAQRERRA